MKYLFCNWKNYLNFQQSFELANNISQIDFSESVDFCVFPSNLVVSRILEILPNRFVGVQNINEHFQGAWTGENTINLLLDLQIKRVLVGHSERRVFFQESDELINKKLSALLEYNIQPILCLNDGSDPDLNLEERKKILEKQIKICCKDIDVSRIVFAYEPIWSIKGFGGTKPAEFEQVFVMHKFIFELLGQEVILLYGGSVSADIDERFFQSNYIKGFLVGSASTEWDSFYRLYNKILAYT